MMSAPNAVKVAINGWFMQDANVGSGQYIRNLLPALREAAPHWQFEVVEPRGRGDLAKVWFEQSTFPRAARRMQADIAFVPYWGPPLKSNVPVVCTVHDVIPLALPQYRGKLHHRLYSSLARASVANCAAVITDSEHSRSDIPKWLPVAAENVTAVPLAAGPQFTPGVPEADRARARARYELPERYALYLGGFDPRKNIETLLQTWTWAGDTIGHETKLLINGMPETPVTTAAGASTTLGALADALEMDDSVYFIGRVDEEDKPAVYAQARCFVFTSLYEGFGLPPLEAMACGVPVVAGNASSVPEVVGNAGYLIDPMNARQMAGSLILVCTDDEVHNKFAQRALLRSAQFTWQRTAYETLAVFKKLVDQ